MTTAPHDPVTTTADGTLTVRLFAAAAEAAGVEELDLTLSEPTSLAAVLARLPDAVGTGDPGEPGESGHPGGLEQLPRVLARCSFLINGVRAAAETTPLKPGDQVDVLPPFAGG
ncbi:MoaD/ThiS family protein [Nesterenkonia xinjiangensis]|uniref:Molybdopterin converting factor small subunit n=1 Tax=Nesterenkonia xinjiangensis TaxID=225327 RepID=A0A7Z0GNF1_9MICC|nr:MoaD/ThiS family protein [Nesterenkonia xinjiangensis]NYJ79137.1 molybdopterin converting factor small subunit [Nesterenkonia xinjiangensis]